MTNEEAIAIIRNEYKCVDRDCDIERSCGKCDLMMPNKEPILEAYKLAIKALSQEPTDTWSIKEVADTFKKHGLIREQQPCGMTAEEYRQRMIQAFHNADTDELIAVCVLPTEKEFEHLEWLLKNHYKKAPCDDAISRKAALEKMADYVASGYADSAEDFEEYSRIICQLPSVTQKYGEWIDYRDEGFVECPFCGHATNCEDNIDELHYCFYCGARMTEPQESEE